MKHIPTLTLTALAAAAVAQTAPAPAAKQELSYTRVIVQTITGSDAADGLAVTGQAKLGNGLYVTATSFDTDGGNDSVAALGYAHTLPSVAGITADLNIELGAESLGVGLRALVGFGLELGISYTEEDQTIQTNAVSASYSLGQFVKGLSLNVNYLDTEGSQATLVGLGYNF